MRRGAWGAAGPVTVGSGGQQNIQLKQEVTCLGGSLVAKSMCLIQAQSLGESAHAARLALELAAGVLEFFHLQVTTGGVEVAGTG